MTDEYLDASGLTTMLTSQKAKTDALYATKTELSAKADASALANKVDKVSGKGLSTNDFTDTYKGKVDTNVSDIAELKEDLVELDEDVTELNNALAKCLYIDNEGYICLKEA